MNKAQLVDKVVQSTDITKSQAELILTKTFDIIQKTVADGNEVKLLGFGTFLQLNRKSRVGRNPQTGVSLTIPSTKCPKFRAGKEFKELIEQG